MRTDDRSAHERSRTMRAVHSKDTAPELALRSLVHGMGYRYQLYRADLPGKPDLVLPGRRKVIFLHGCFWHGHECPRGNRLPITNREYWTKKLERNRLRDTVSVSKLEELGWQVLVIWECELRHPDLLRDKIKEFMLCGRSPSDKDKNL